VGASKYPNEQNSKLIDENGLPISDNNKLPVKVPDGVKIIDAGSGNPISQSNPLDTKLVGTDNRVKLTDGEHIAQVDENGRLEVTVNNTATVSVTNTPTVSIGQNGGQNHVEVVDAAGNANSFAYPLQVNAQIAPNEEIIIANQNGVIASGNPLHVTGSTTVSGTINANITNTPSVTASISQNAGANHVEIVDASGNANSFAYPLQVNAQIAANEEIIVANQNGAIANGNPLHTTVTNSISVGNVVQVQNTVGNPLSVKTSGTDTVSITSSTGAANIPVNIQNTPTVAISQEAVGNHIKIVDQSGNLVTFANAFPVVTKFSATDNQVRVTDGTDELKINTDGTLSVRLTDGSDTASIDEQGHLQVDVVTMPSINIETVGINQITPGANHVEIIAANGNVNSAQNPLHTQVNNLITPQDEADFIDKNYILYENYIKDASLPLNSRYPYADAKPPTLDPFGRDGWHYRNNWTGNPSVNDKKINWYFYDYEQTSQMYSDLKNAYALITFDKGVTENTSRPFLFVYLYDASTSTSYNVNYINVAPGSPTTYEAGKTYLFWFGLEAPTVFPEYPRVELIPSGTVPPTHATLPITQIALTTQSNATANSIEIQVYNLGYKVTAYTAQSRLRMSIYDKTVALDQVIPGANHVEIVNSSGVVNSANSPVFVKAHLADATNASHVVKVDNNGSINAKITNDNTSPIAAIITNNPTILLDQTTAGANHVELVDASGTPMGTSAAPLVVSVQSAPTTNVRTNGSDTVAVTGSVSATVSGTVGLSTSANTVKIDPDNNNVQLVNSGNVEIGTVTDPLIVGGSVNISTLPAVSFSGTPSVQLANNVNNDIRIKSGLNVASVDESGNLSVKNTGFQKTTLYTSGESEINHSVVGGIRSLRVDSTHVTQPVQLTGTNTVDLSTTNNTVKLDTVYNQVKLSDGTRTVGVTTANALKVDIGNPSLSVNINPEINTVKIDSLNNTVGLSTSANTVKIDSSNNTVQLSRKTDIKTKVGTISVGTLSTTLIDAIVNKKIRLLSASFDCVTGTSSVVTFSIGATEVGRFRSPANTQSAFVQKTLDFNEGFLGGVNESLTISATTAIATAVVTTLVYVEE
jgi:hypothetical protein